MTEVIKGEEGLVRKDSKVLSGLEEEKNENSVSRVLEVV